MRRPSALLSACALLCAASALALYAQIAHAPAADEPALPDGSHGVERAPAEVALEVPAVPAWPELAARPLFTSTRRPSPPPAAAAVPAPPPAPAPPPPPAPPNLVLVGIVASGDRQLAILQQPGGHGTQVVALGDTVQGWQIARILSDRLVLRANTVEQELRFPAWSDQHGMQSPARSVPPPAALPPLQPVPPGRR
jgi:general secretion pathway protein N